MREARELGRLNIRYEQERRDVSTSISGRRAQLKAANSAALRQRRSVTQALLRYVVPSDSSVRVELTEAAAGSKSHAETVASTRAVARILEALRQDGALTRLLDDLHYTDATVEELRTLAADVERLSAQGAGLRPPQWTDQPTLDRQDGLVLCLMRAIWDPLREAKLDGAGIALPPVGSLERFFIRTSSPEDESDGDDAGGEIVASDGPPAA